MQIDEFGIALHEIDLFVVLGHLVFIYLKLEDFLSVKLADNGDLPKWLIKWCG
ncbi:hypothetical protein D3C80_1968060 [compost metagenome]